MKPFNKCCFCCSLETGAYVWAILGFIGCLFNFIVACRALDEAITANFSVLKPVAEILWSVVTAIVFILLVIGAWKRKSGFIIPYLFYDVLNVILSIGLLVLIFQQVEGQSADGENMFIYAAIIIICGDIISIYSLICMWSLYAQIRDEKRVGSNYNRFTA